MANGGVVTIEVTDEGFFERVCIGRDNRYRVLERRDSRDRRGVVACCTPRIPEPGRLLLPQTERSGTGSHMWIQCDHHGPCLFGRAPAQFCLRSSRLVIV